LIKIRTPPCLSFLCFLLAQVYRARHASSSSGSLTLRFPYHQVDLMRNSCVTPAYSPAKCTWLNLKQTLPLAHGGRRTAVRDCAAIKVKEHERQKTLRNINRATGKGLQLTAGLIASFFCKATSSRLKADFCGSRWAVAVAEMSGAACARNLTETQTTVHCALLTHLDTDCLCSEIAMLAILQVFIRH